MTPAQASGHPNLSDVPVQGPTDPGMRGADCWFAQNRLPKNPACVDCEGSIPMWTRTSISNVRGSSSGVGEQLSFGSGALAGAGDPSVWEKLSRAQQEWVAASLIKLNNLIVTTTKTTCPTFGPSVTAAGGCFQAWFNSSTKGAMTKADGSKLVLRTDGVFDQDTLDALITITGMHGKDFQVPYPAGAALEKKGLSTGAMVGVGVAGVAVLGGIAYYAMRGKKTRRGGKKARSNRRR